MKKILSFLDKYLEETILCILLLFMTVFMMGDILSRTFLGKSIRWSIEFCQYCFVYTSFLAIPFCVKQSSNLKIDVLISFFSEKFKKLFAVVSETICLVVWTLFFVYSWSVLQESLTHVQYSTSMGIPLYWVYGIPFVACFLAVIREIQAVISLALSMRNTGEENNEGSGKE